MANEKNTENQSAFKELVLPVIVLVWCLMVERLSPGLSAFWATMLMVFILLTQRPLFALFRGEGHFGAAVRCGYDDLVEGLIAGARNMIGIGIATATAGIIVGAVSQTGVGLVLADLVEILSLGNILLMLILTAVLSLILPLLPFIFALSFFTELWRQFGPKASTAPAE